MRQLPLPSLVIKVGYLETRGDLWMDGDRWEHYGSRKIRDTNESPAIPIFSKN